MGGVASVIKMFVKVLGDVVKISIKIVAGTALKAGDYRSAFDIFETLTGGNFIEALDGAAGLLLFGGAKVSDVFTGDYEAVWASHAFNPMSWKNTGNRIWGATGAKYKKDITHKKDQHHNTMMAGHRPHTQEEIDEFTARVLFEDTRTTILKEVTEDGLLMLVDSKSEAVVDHILNNKEELNFKPEKVKIIPYTSLATEDKSGKVVSKGFKDDTLDFEKIAPFFNVEIVMIPSDITRLENVEAFNKSTLKLKSVLVIDPDENSSNDVLDDLSGSGVLIKQQKFTSRDGNVDESSDDEYPMLIIYPSNYTLYNANGYFPTPVMEYTIPSNITTIGPYAFARASALTSVKVAQDSKLTKIGEGAFQYASNLASITIPKSVVTIGEGAFEGAKVDHDVVGMSNLTSVTFEDISNSQLTSIGPHAFKHATKLTEITIPASVTSIGYRAFYSALYLKTVTFEPNSKLTDISNNVFDYVGLTSITIPSSVTSIGNNAFLYAVSLTSVSIPSSVTSIGDSAFSDATALTSVTIPASVTSIGKQAFYRTEALKTVTFEDISNSQLTSIGSYAFNSSALTSISIPASVTTIGIYAFYRASNLETVTFEPDSQLTRIGNSAFHGASALTSIIIPKSVTSIGNYAFDTASSLETVTFEANSKLTYIGYNVFDGVSKIASIIIPKRVTYIGSNTFERKRNLTSVTFEDISNSQLTRIGQQAFKEASALTSITIPASVTSIEPRAFEGVTNLTSVTFHDISNSELTSIGNSAFQGATGLTSIIIPKSVTSIGTQVFYGASKLETVTFELGSSLNKIGEDVFANLNLNHIGRNFTINIPVNNSSIMNNFAKNIPKDKMKVYDQIVYLDTNSNRKVESFYPDGSGNFNKNTLSSIDISLNTLASINIPASFSSIEEEAFLDASGLVSITIPSSVTIIGANAFQNCSGLTSINIPASVTSIGSNAFQGASALTSVTVEANSQLTSIGEGAFLDASGLIEITIPKKITEITSIGENAFSGTSSLKNIYFRKDVTIAPFYISIDNSGTIQSDFYGNNSGSIKGDIVINRNSTSILFNDLVDINLLDTKSIHKDLTFNNNKTISDIKSIEIAPGITDISGEAFMDCSLVNFLYVTVESNGKILDDIEFDLTSIGAKAFKGATSLTSVSIPASVTTIGEEAFRGATRLETVTFQANSSLNSIGQTAFAYTTLTSIIIPSKVTSIGHNAFFEASALTSINIPEGVTSIGSYAFYGASSLTSISIPAGVTSIGDGAFRNAPNLETVTFEAGSQLTTIGTEVFYGASSLIEITIPSSVTSIGDRAFQSASSLTSITIPSSVISIGTSAFADAINVTHISIPATISSIGNYAFQGASSGVSDTLIVEITDDPNDVPNDHIKEVTFFAGPETFSGSNYTTAALKLPDSIIPEKISELGSVRNFSTFYISESSLTTNNNDTSNNLVFGTHDNTIGTNTDVTILNVIDASNNDYPLGAKFEFVDSSNNQQEKNIYLSSSTLSRNSFIREGTYDGRGYYIDNIHKVTSVDLSGQTGIIIKAIDNNAFYGASALTSITIPASVTSIGADAFHGASALTSITFEAGSQLTSIGAQAFFQATSLTSISIPASVKSIGGRAFESASALTTITFGVDSSLNSIGDAAFKYASSLTSITIPANVTSMGFDTNNTMFRGATNLSSVTFEPNSQLTRIENHMFNGASKLTSIEIPKSVTSIGSYAFYQASALTKVTFEDVLNSQLTSIGDDAFSSTSIQLFELPESVTEIGTNALSYDVDTTKSSSIIIFDDKLPDISFDISFNIFDTIIDLVVIGPNTMDRIAINNSFATQPWKIDGVVKFVEYASQSQSHTEITTISNETFNVNVLTKDSVTNYNRYKIQEISSIAFGSNIISIEDELLKDASSLKSINIPITVRSIGKNVFQNASALTSVTFENSSFSYLTSIGDGAFQGVSSLTSIDIPENVESIGASAFQDASGLTSIIIPENVESIGASAFQDASNLTSVTFEANSLSLEVNNKAQITSIEENTFRGASSLINISLPKSVTSIGANAFRSSALTAITISPYVESIGGGAFQDASGLEIVILKTFHGTSFLREIGVYAFQGASALTSISIPKNVTSIGTHAFQGASSLETVTFDTDSNLTSIGEQAFYGVNNLSSIIIPKSVTSIGTDAFYEASKLTSVTFEDNSELTSIGHGVFEGAIAMTSIDIPKKVTEIHDSAFNHCSALKSINIPESVINISEDAFSNTNNLQTFTMNNTNVTKGSNSGGYKTIENILYDTDSSGVNNIFHRPHNYRNPLVVISENTITIETPEFLNNDIKDIDISENIQEISIGTSSVYNDISGIMFNASGNKLIKYPPARTNTSYVVPENVTSIENNAFKNVQHLTSITFPPNYEFQPRKSLPEIFANKDELTISLTQKTFDTLYNSRRFDISDNLDVSGFYFQSEIEYIYHLKKTLIRTETLQRIADSIINDSSFNDFKNDMVVDASNTSIITTLEDISGSTSGLRNKAVIKIPTSNKFSSLDTNKKNDYITLLKKLYVTNLNDANISEDNVIVTLSRGSIEANIEVYDSSSSAREAEQTKSSTITSVPICFPAGTPVTTDQGNISIETLDTDIHTINGKEIIAITQTIPVHNYIISIEKDALGVNVPSQTTEISKEHKVYYNGIMVKAKELVTMCENVTKVPYNGEILYNVLLKKHGKMMINNLICETLHPDNIMAKICGGHLETIEKNQILKALGSVSKLITPSYTRSNV